MRIVLTAVICATMLVATPLHKALAQEDARMPWAIGGTGGAYLLVESGELEVRVFKRDLNVRGAMGTDLRAILAGPDRAVRREIRPVPCRARC